MGRQSETSVKVPALVDIFDCEGNIDSVQCIEDCKNLESAVDKSGVVFCVYCVSCKRAGLFILQGYYVFI